MGQPVAAQRFHLTNSHSEPSGSLRERLRTAVVTLHVRFKRTGTLRELAWLLVVLLALAAWLWVLASASTHHR